MLAKIATPTAIARKIRARPTGELVADDVQPAREFIEAYWKKLEKYNPVDDQTLIGLPNPYLVPAHESGHGFDFNEMYYWDSYFMAQGLLDEAHKALVMGMLDNLIALYRRMHIIPNASRTYFAGRSQPPLLTSFILDVYGAYNPGKKWLKDMMAVAQDEYLNVWMGTAKPHWRKVYKGLSRYYDINVLHDLAETESGWDMTTRFNRKALNYLPVDLNALLYKYEMDFAWAAHLTGRPIEARIWEERADARRHVMDDLMWRKDRGFYYDYNYVAEKRGGVMSLAGYYPMWAGMVSEQQAAKMVKNLKRFENKGGLATTDTQPLNQLVPGFLPTQWAHPNGWAPLHFLVVKGLQRYGYDAEARRIALKWVKCNLDWYNKHGVFLEKYNVVQPDKPPVKGVYPSQVGFGWTNAVFERFCQEFIDSTE